MPPQNWRAREGGEEREEEDTRWHVWQEWLWKEIRGDVKNIKKSEREKMEKEEEKKREMRYTRFLHSSIYQPCQFHLNEHLASNPKVNPLSASSGNEWVSLSFFLAAKHLDTLTLMLGSTKEAQMEIY